MKTTVVFLTAIDGETFVTLSAGNESGSKITLRLPADRLFEDDGQLLMKSVFGPTLTCLLRGEPSYRKLEREQEREEHTTGLVRQLEGDDEALEKWYTDALETF